MCAEDQTQRDCSFNTRRTETHMSQEESQANGQRIIQGHWKGLVCKKRSVYKQKLLT